MKKNQVLEAYKRKRIQELGGEKGEQFRENVILSIKKELESKTDRSIFIIPDIDVVNPLVKLMYDLALENKNNGYNTLIVHEKEGFKPSWLTGATEIYNGIPVMFLSNRAGKKSGRLKAGFNFKFTDSIYVSDLNLELVQDLSNDKEFSMIQKTLIVTGYSGLYTLNPGSNLQLAGISSTIIFDEQVYLDYQDLFPGVKHNHIVSYKIDGYENFNFKVEEEGKKEPYLLLTGVGNGEKLSQIVNIFYNKYPLLNFIKLKVVNRSSISYYLNDLKGAIALVDFDRQYVTNFNSLNSWVFGVPYFSTNGYIENARNSNNLLSAEASLDLFSVVDYLQKMLLNYVTSTTKSVKDTLVPNNEIISSLKGLFESGVKKSFEDIRETKIKRFENLINDAKQ